MFIVLIMTNMMFAMIYYNVYGYNISWKRLDPHELVYPFNTSPIFYLLDENEVKVVWADNMPFVARIHYAVLYENDWACQTH